MNWYTTSKLAMPLPLAVNAPKLTGGPVGAIHEKLTQPQADQINQDHPNLHFLGQGSAGLAYGYNDPTKVVKLTRDGMEAERAKTLINQPAKCHVKVFDVQEAGQGVWKLVLEKVRPLQDEEIEVFDLVHAYGNQVLKNKYATQNYEPSLIRKCIQEYQQLTQCLRAAGVSDEDAQGENLGRRNNGQLVLLDVG